MNLWLEIAKILKTDIETLRKVSYNDVLALLVNKIKNDCIDIEDMFQYMEELKERK